MNLSEMLHREKFPDVELQTIQDYYRIRYGAEIEIHKEPISDATKLYLYRRPLFFASTKIPKGARELLYGEYNVRGSLIKFLIAKAGIFALTHWSKVFSSACYYIYPKLSNQAIYICPCNRSVRFFDFEHDTVDCVVKTGYDDLYMDNHLNFREKHTEPFIPKILNRGRNWYTEQIMHGHALARITNTSIYEQSLKTALEYMKELSINTRKIVSTYEYSELLFTTLQKLVKSIYKAEKNNDASHLLTLGANLSQIIKSQSFDVPLCMSHGDLQTGNIWVNTDGQVLIYDWETVGLRTIWYDPATLLLGLRSKPYSDDIKRLLTDDKRYLAFDSNKDYTDEEISCIEHIIIYEDLIFQLTEVTQLAKEYQIKRAKEIIGLIRNSNYWRMA